LLGQDPSRMRSVLAWSARGVCKLRHGARGAGACCSLCVKAVFKHCGQSGHSARTCLVLLADRGQQHQKQHILTPASAKPAPAQHRAHRCSVCGEERHAYVHTHTCMRTQCVHTSTRGHAHAHAQAYTHAHTYTLHKQHVMGFAKFLSVASNAPSLVPFKMGSLSQANCFSSITDSC